MKSTENHELINRIEDLIFKLSNYELGFVKGYQKIGEIDESLNSLDEEDLLKLLCEMHDSNPEKELEELIDFFCEDIAFKLCDELVMYLLNGLAKEHHSAANLKSIFFYYLDSFKDFYELKAIRSNESFIKLIQFLENILNLQIKKAENKNKLEWAGSPSQFGYIFNELVEKGFIVCPTTHLTPSIKKFAKICIENFELSSTIQNIEKELNPEKNTLSDYKRNFFKIHNINDLKSNVTVSDGVETIP